VSDQCESRTWKWAKGGEERGRSGLEDAGRRRGVQERRRTAAHLAIYTTLLHDVWDLWGTLGASIVSGSHSVFAGWRGSEGQGGREEGPAGA